MEAQLPLDVLLTRDFDRVATRYDLLNALNPGYRKHLTWSATRLRLAGDADVLDLCCGTGLSTEALRAVYPAATITGLDASHGMLHVARQKRALSGVRFLQGNAMDPRTYGASGPYDGILMAYGIRNVPDRDLCLARLRALLKPKGRVAFHEYSVADNPLARAMWNAVASAVIVPLGSLITRTPQLFRYLRSSVNEFDGVKAFKARLVRAGFHRIEVFPMDGWQRGVTHTFVAEVAP